jgi:hypothetical protein
MMHLRFLTGEFVLFILLIVSGLLGPFAPSKLLSLHKIRLDLDRPVWKTLWNNPQLLEGRKRTVAGQLQGGGGVVG